MVNAELNKLESHLKERGYKLTSQRKVILDIIIQNEGKHLSTEELYDLVRIKNPEIGLATVYRTVQLLEELEVIYKHYFDDGCSRYELNHENEDHHHHHLICINCGNVTEVEEDLLGDLELKIEKNKGFHITDHKVKFFGYCSDCHNKSKAP